MSTDVVMRTLGCLAPLAALVAAAWFLSIVCGRIACG